MSDRKKGVIYIILSALSFAFMGLFVRLAGDLPAIEKSFFRNLVAMLFALVLLLKEGYRPDFNKKAYIPLTLRSIGGTLGILGNFYALGKLNLADASILNKMSPFFVLIFSYLILKEKLKPYQIIAVIVAFLGSMFVVKPSFQNVDFIPALLGLFGEICAGFAYTMVRKAGEMGVKGTFIVFFFSAFSCLATLPYLIFAFKPMSGLQFLYLMLAGLSASLGQFTITAAYCHAPAKEIAIFDYTQILFSSLLGLVILNQVPDHWSFIGYTIIILAAVFNLLFEQRLNHHHLNNGV